MPLRVLLLIHRRICGPVKKMWKYVILMVVVFQTSGTGHDMECIPESKYCMHRIGRDTVLQAGIQTEATINR